MNNFTLNTKIILRNDTRANWELANPVLTKGEMGVEVDTGKVKIGDGVKAWAELGYANVLPSELEGLNYGDMHKKVYDTNGDGKVDSADLADKALLADEATHAVKADEATVAGKLKTPVNIAGVEFDGSSDIELTKANVGLGNVDNTSDLNKPISLATQSALDAIKGSAGAGVDLGTVDAKADANTAEINAVKGRMTTAEGKVTALEELTTTQGQKITAVEQKAQANASDITALGQRVTANEGAIGTLESTVEEHGTRLTTVENKAKANATAITALEERANASESEITALKATTGEHGTRLSAVEQKATDNAGEIEALKGKMTSAEGRISTVENKVVTVEEKVTTLESKVDVDKVSTAISSAIAESEAKLGTSASRNVGTAVGDVVEVLADGKIASSLIPSIAITDTFVVDSEEAMLALTKAEKGDIAIRTDVKETYILVENGYSNIENWKVLETPTDAVTSVNGHVGAVTLTTTDIAEGSNLYFTEERAKASFQTFSSTSLADSDTILRVTDTLILNGGNA